MLSSDRVAYLLLFKKPRRFLRLIEWLGITYIFKRIFLNLTHSMLDISAQFIKDTLEGWQVGPFISGFTPRQYLNFLNIYLDRPEHQALDMAGASLNSRTLPEDVNLFIEGKNLPQGLSSCLPRFIRETIIGYENITQTPIRRFMRVAIEPRKVCGVILFDIVVNVPSLGEELVFDDPYFVPECTEPINQVLKDLGKRIESLEDGSFNDVPYVTLRADDISLLLNALANEGIELGTVRSPDGVLFTPDHMR